MKSFYKKELYEYKLDILYYGISISQSCYNSLKKGKHNQINNNDYITTKGLMIALDSKIYVNADLNKNSYYTADFVNNEYILKYKDLFICKINIIQPPDFALQFSRLNTGRPLIAYVNVHGDRIRVQPIEGCANKCKFCDLNKKKYKLNSLEDLNEAFKYAMNNVGFRHVLISGGTPKKSQEDYQYLNNVYKFFGKKYGKKYPIDIMLVPRGLNVDDNTIEGYETFLRKLKEWNISGLSINLELYNDDYRKKYIPQKDFVGKQDYFEFIKLAVKIFGKRNIRSCIIIGLEGINDSLKAVEELCKIDCMPVLSPYIPNDNETFLPKPEFMKEVLLKSKVIADKYNVELGPICNSCKHNTINF